jgi:hypothetical protein
MEFPSSWPDSEDDDGMRPIELEFAGEIAMVETVLAEEVGDGLWYLHETPLFGSELARFAEVIEVEPTKEGRLRFLRVVERSPYRTWDWILTERLILSPEFEALKERIMAEGGNWEHAMGGLFMAHLPPESTLDPEAEVARIRAAAAPQTTSPAHRSPTRTPPASTPPASSPWWRFWR